MRLYSIIILLTLGLTCSLNACKPSHQSSSTKSDPGHVASDTSAIDADTYTVSLPTAKTPLTVTPKPGYKINADFPHRAILSAGDLKETANVDHTEKRLIFNATKEGKFPTKGVKADLSFSVCNDQMCKLYKESYEW